MKLNLIRPLAFFDLETTGINVGSDRIVEIAILKAMPDGSELVKTLRIHPEMPIPLQSSLIHGIYDEHIADAPKFKEVAAEIAEFIGDADLAGYNSNRFDIPVLLEEFLRVGVDFDMTGRKFVDVQNVFHQMEQRTLRAAYKFYCDKDIVNAHSAEADIKATYHVLLAQLDRYENVDFEDKQGNISQPVKNDVEALHAFTNMNKPVDFAGRMVFNENDEEVFNFGKHKNKTVEHVFDTEPSYYAWMKQGDFPLYTKKKLEEIWTRWNKKKELSRAAKIPSAPKPAEQANAVKPKPAAPAQPRPQQAGGQVRQPAQQPKKEKPAVSVTPDMLEQLKMKFGK
ncbi:DNA polymerase-3 subunit epsilon [Pedobacter cryoconitis]|uniref:DNA polymerase-3 subunit epsilon n=1 Tax=Pedobacter cryoconitis TaxID=188932 RepID=A0A7W8ZNE0_9SPHI|nr:3'-5' exonuclease [Pedobacter cryoconitis]MBB5636977.1 DNA polymerase-3 subunit epsilon [Pedobacter cryoconitis]MBB6271379.1 DNA polymerase-3 subunit epsilon [Pedobacter cryoconitis]